MLLRRKNLLLFRFYSIIPELPHFTLCRLNHLPQNHSLVACGREYTSFSSCLSTEHVSRAKLNEKKTMTVAKDGVNVTGTGRDINGEGKLGGRWISQGLYY